ncbi:hypothetical protein OG689_41680 [Kitasatospora sp. NBC_00240]|uniref:hypothetical protein n=1 Tax=Kitasatospora sp. NBC_00240 TaxID=2903567 RepID=UPI0022509AB2|nr:hypothetical protein [Kitasatospora sp. NBC_00240]MCX5215669.1 hypothetical protein [Kitasatospora sp. NBC_00240]
MDQQPNRGNGTILKHRTEGRTLRLFTLLPGALPRYLGAYALDPQVPYVRADVRAESGTADRSVLVFRLLPLDCPPTTLPGTDAVATELQLKRTAPLQASPTPLHWSDLLPGQKAAWTLSEAYERHLRLTEGHEVTGYRITLPGHLTPFPVQLFDLTRNELVVVRAVTARSSLLLALGELFDLVRHFADTPRKLLLLAKQPDDTFLELCAEKNVTVSWPDGTGTFVRAPSV